MKLNELVFDCFHLYYCKCNKINPNCGGSYIDSPDWIKNKTATINHKYDNKCFQYATTRALDNKKVKNSERMTKK